MELNPEPYPGIYDSGNEISSVIAVTDTAKNKEKFQAIAFLSAVAGASFLIGSSTTIAAVRKQDPKYFTEGLAPLKVVGESGASLALRALGWGSLFAVSGCGILFYGIWKLSGATNAFEFRQKMGSILPRIPKNNPPQGRTEFDGINDLLKYLSEDRSGEKIHLCED